MNTQFAAAIARIDQSIADYTRFIDKESARADDLRPAHVQIVLDDYRAGRCKLQKVRGVLTGSCNPAQELIDLERQAVLKVGEAQAFWGVAHGGSVRTAAMDACRHTTALDC